MTLEDAFLVVTSVVFTTTTGRSAGNGVSLSLRYEVGALFPKAALFIGNVHSGWGSSILCNGVETLGVEVTSLLLSGATMENYRIQSQMETH